MERLSVGGLMLAVGSWPRGIFPVALARMFPRFSRAGRGRCGEFEHVLGLEGEEDSDPLVVRQMDDHSAVLPGTILVSVGSGIALVHMDIVNAVSGLETEVLIGFARLRPPFLTKSEDFAAGHRARDVLVQQIAEWSVSRGFIC